MFVFRTYDSRIANIIQAFLFIVFGALMAYIFREDLKIISICFCVISLCGVALLFVELFIQK